MTLVVVTKTEVIADSKTVFGGSHAETVRKIHVIDGHIVTSAGDPLLANAAALAGIQSSFNAQSMSAFGNDGDHTFVIVITPDDAVRTCYLGDKDPYWGLVDCTTNESEVAVMTGSGRNFFLAFLAEHGDVHKAFGLVCDHHENVGWPIMSYSRTERTTEIIHKQKPATEKE